VAILGIAVLALGIASCGKSLPTQAGPPPAALGHDETFARAGGGGGGGSGKSTTFSGQATAIRATVLGSNIVLSDAGPLPSAGGAEEASLLRAEVPGLLTARVLHAATIGQGDRSRSEASTADLDLTVGGQHVAASFLMARAEARCSKGKATTSGGSEVVNLTINGQAIVVSGQPNQTILLPVGAGRVVINEQTSSPGTITVNALHVVVTGIADVVISSAHADISCGGVDCTGAKDFVTGGGWITGTPSGAKGTFGVAGGIKNGGFWGHLTYIDHGAGGPKVKGTGVTAYSVVSATARHIEGTCEIDGQGGFSYEVDVADNGEPGRSDTFDLRVSNGYSASGTLGGGNIQLHTPCR
jgi:hypothetical protein